MSHKLPTIDWIGFDSCCTHAEAIYSKIEHSSVLRIDRPFFTLNIVTPTFTLYLPLCLAWNRYTFAIVRVCCTLDGISKHQYQRALPLPGITDGEARLRQEHSIADKDTVSVPAR